MDGHQGGKGFVTVGTLAPSDRTHVVLLLGVGAQVGRLGESAREKEDEFSGENNTYSVSEK